MSGNDCRHICARLLSTFTAQAGPLSQSNIWVIFFAILLTVFSKSKTDFGSCSLIPFESSVPEGSAPVTSRPHRINPISAKKVDATLNQYLAAGLIQHSTSPYSSPLVVIPKTSVGVRITANYKKLNKISSLSQLPTPRVDQGLDSLGKGRAFSLFDLFSSSCRRRHV